MNYDKIFQMFKLLKKKSPENIRTLGDYMANLIFW